MLDLDDIKVEFECQGFRSSHMGISPEKYAAILFIQSTRKTDEVHRDIVALLAWSASQCSVSLPAERTPSSAAGGGARSSS